jgi:hypothetical protein
MSKCVKLHNTSINQTINTIKGIFDMKAISMRIFGIKATTMMIFRTRTTHVMIFLYGDASPLAVELQAMPWPPLYRPP